MGQPAEKLTRATYAVDLGRRATYADLEAVEPGKVAELVDGELYVFPRPAPRHLNAASVLTGKLSGPFQFGHGGPVAAGPEKREDRAAQVRPCPEVEPDERSPHSQYSSGRAGLASSPWRH